MTPTERDRELDRLFQELKVLYGGKGIEYATEVDILQNFKNGSQLGLTSLQKLGVYLDKHLSSIFSYIRNNGKTFSNEPIEGRINDAIAYLFLMKCLIKDEYEKENTEE